MADTFTVVQSYEDVEFLGGTATRNVQVAGCVTTGHGIYFEVRIPSTEFAASGPESVNAAAAGYADIFETIANEANVVGVQWGQQTYGGQLQDVAIIEVSSDSGDSTGSITTPVTSLGPQLDKSQITALNKRLNATEAL